MEKKDKIIWILKAHRDTNKKYGDLPYATHLQDVVNWVRKFKHLLTEDEFELAELAGWGHDVIEDTDMTYNDVKKALGERVADLIFLLTNLRGKTRAERANDDYYIGIKTDDIAIFVKMCDRLANMTYGLHHGNKDMFLGYKKELPNFKEKLFLDRFKEMWDLLDNMDQINIEKNFFFPNIEKFDDDNFWTIKLPHPIPGDLYRELYAKGIIPKKDLVKGRYYFGKCRNAKTAVWNGHCFVYMRTKFNAIFPEDINHLEDDNGYDLFVPLRETKPEPTEIVKYE